MTTPPDYLEKKNVHPRDEFISFDEGPHIYTVHGDSSFTSVTTWNHTHFPHFDSDAIIDKISKAGVAVNVHFQPLPLLSLFKSYGYKIEDYPNAYNNYKAEISLPIYPQLTQEELDYIVSTISNAVESTL